MTDYIREALMDKYTLQLCRYEMSLYHGRQTRLMVQCKDILIQRQLKMRLRLMYIASNVKSLYTKTAISKELHITRRPHTRWSTSAWMLAGLS